MAEPWTADYIPAGCLHIQSTQEDLPPGVWEIIRQQQGWCFFRRPGDTDIPQPVALPQSAQQEILKSSVLKPFNSLFQNRWIQCSITILSRIENLSVATIRVYILPQDVNRRYVNSPTTELIKAMSVLISRLELSNDCWSGKEVFTSQTEAILSDPVTRFDGTDTSLLAMFNNLPSPDPQPEKVSDPYTRELMQCLLESQVSGLTTKLFPYQGQSAALMVRMEAIPGMTVDPRLRFLPDQAGRTWYHDSVSGVVLREPRYYDGPRGGILAEEMGTGKTLMCLALILATRRHPAAAPAPFTAQTRSRHGVGSLMDMAAASANRNSVPWEPWFEAYEDQHHLYFERCKQALSAPEHMAFYQYSKTLVEPRRTGRHAPRLEPSTRVYLSSTTLIIVPNNLVKQWENEIEKHTTGLKVLVMEKDKEMPPKTTLLNYDIILFSETRFVRSFPILPTPAKADSTELATNDRNPLEHICFKRCIIDEGHKLGTRGRAYKNGVMTVLDRLHIYSRWVVTGTPSRGLYGIDPENTVASESSMNQDLQRRVNTGLKQEREDLQRIGNMAAKFLRVRPWANSKDETGDTPADWNVYVMHPKQHSRAHNRKDCLKITLRSLIIRHQLSDVKKLLPPVNEKVVLLDGSFQDQLSMNLFSMMIIFNSVQSQRTDMDYFFHERQRQSLQQLVKNLRQACFFGGVFYSKQDIAKALETAEDFLEKKAIPISAEDEDRLKEAIDFGKIAVGNHLKDISNQYHALPIYLEYFPGGNGRSWSLDDRDATDEPVCTDAGLILSLQKFLNPCIDAPTSLRRMIDDGRLSQQGVAERSEALAAAAGNVPANHTPTALAGNTPLGVDQHSKLKSGSLMKGSISLVEETQDQLKAGTDIEIAEDLAKTKIISTVSAKLSYLIDAIVKYQNEEQIIIFYDNDNIAWYLAGVLEILQIQHLIYTRRGLSPERRAQYVATFTHSSRFRVLLMDISQAAFGLDMRSASRIYFISPVLNPQVEAQAIGRARRISQQKPVTVETLVLRNSIEEVILNRRQNMTQVEHSRVRTVLEDRRIYDWIRDARISPMTAAMEDDGVAQTARLETPQFVFGRGFGRDFDPDEGLVTGGPVAASAAKANGNRNGETSGAARVGLPVRLERPMKRVTLSEEDVEQTAAKKKQKKSVGFAEKDDLRL
ncbi:P-loop containing nucleoside triphosphate hydrolase protein [Xylariomycetidae sp. FL2044]|nr:P-loop containing nucleoside triphosphate hydrolase protein [Xylariomycetidae sp. FL2044]